MGQQREPGPSTSSQSLVNIGPGLPAVSRRLIDRIKANEFVDFAELPPAKGKSRPPPQVGEGQIVVLQAADLAPTRRTIPDLATWLQCFGLYVAVIAQSQPERVPELMAYQAIIAKASTKYRWPSWLVYDTSFRQEVAGTVGQSWARVDPSIYSVCFFGQNISGENWCQSCQSLDHTGQACPTRPKKRAWAATMTPGGGQRRPPRAEVCQKFNKFAGDCKFGRDCKFRHICSACGDPHPVSHCKRGDIARQGGN